MSGPLILVVEDNPLNAKLMRDVLRSRGYEVVETTTAEEGIELARSRQPACVLMDIQLPGMDGIAALGELKKDAATRDIPVIAVTASAMPMERREIMAAGFDGYQSKPLSVKVLTAELAEVLSRSAATSQSSAERILVVDDEPRNVRLLSDLLSVRGYAVSNAASGVEALEKVARERPDLVLLDVMMPGMSGFEVCREIRQDPETRLIPVVMVTALDGKEDRVKGIEAGADDFLSKPIDQLELLARVRSLVRIQELHKTVRRQAAQLEEWNQQLEVRVKEQADQLARMEPLKRFFAPQVTKMIFEGADELLQPHRSRVAVAFADLRGFTQFAESAEPEEVMEVLGLYHAELGRAIEEYEGTLEHFAGDGVMVIFNDPVEVKDFEEKAVRMAVAIRDSCAALCERWNRLGFDLELGIGITTGYATLGAVGFEGRWSYAAIGTVTNLAARLCAEARGGQILVSDRLFAAVEELVDAEPIGELELKGLSRPVVTHNVRALR